MRKLFLLMGVLIAALSRQALAGPMQNYVLWSSATWAPVALSSVTPVDIDTPTASGSFGNSGGGCMPGRDGIRINVPPGQPEFDCGFASISSTAAFSSIVSTQPGNARWGQRFTNLTGNIPLFIDVPLPCGISMICENVALSSGVVTVIQHKPERQPGE